MIDKLITKLKEGEAHHIFDEMLEEHKEELLEDLTAEFKVMMEKQKAEQIEIIQYLENQVSILLRKCNDLAFRVEKLEAVTYKDHQPVIQQYKQQPA